MVESNKLDKARPLERSQATKLDGFADRIQQALSGRSLAWLASETGISTSMMSEYKKGKVPGADKALAIAEVLSVSLKWLLTGEGSRDGAPKVSERQLGYRAGDDDDQVNIASIDFAYGFGGAYLDAGDPNITREQFSRRWLQSEGIYAPPEMIGIARGIGDSMEPELRDRDTLFFDRSARLEDHMSDKIWVFAYGQVGMVKILRPLPNGTIKIISANPRYPEEIAQAEDIHIIGRVVLAVHGY